MPGPSTARNSSAGAATWYDEFELQFADDADRLPCQVVYWKDQESPGEPRVPWRANSDLEFCVVKAREMVDGLQSAGWSCGGAARAVPKCCGAGRDRAVQKIFGGPAMQPTAPPPPDDAADRIAPSEESSRNRPPCSRRRPDDAADQIAPSEESSRGQAVLLATAADDATNRIAPSAGPSREPAAQLTAPPPDDAANGAATSDQATLQAALDRDIRRLEELGGASAGGSSRK